MDNQYKTTCLYSEHLALNAKMSPFAGFMMPIQYSSITAEHNAVRNHAGMFDVSHMGEIFVSGPDAEKFMNHIFTNDVRTMGPGQCLYGMMLYPDAGTVDDLLVYREYLPDHFLLVVNAANVEKDYAWICENSKGFDVKIVDDSANWGQIAVQGRDSEAVLGKVLASDLSGIGFYSFVDIELYGRRAILSRTGYTGEDGFELYACPEAIVDVWKTLVKAGVTPCGLGCRDTLRFEAGLPLYGDELSKDISPVVAGFSMFCKFDKPEFIGREELLRQKTEGTPRKLVGIELQDKAIPRAGYPVVLEDGSEVGVVTTGYHSITLDKSLCFALVNRENGALGSTLNVAIRKKVFPGTVVKKRFYQTNYKK